MNEFTSETVEGLTALEQRQQTLAHMVRRFPEKSATHFSCLGAKVVWAKAARFCGLWTKRGSMPILINSHVTPLSLYGTMFQHRDEQIIFFDDVDSMFSSMAHLGLLRSALWGSPRIVTYGSQLPSDYPPSFEFTSRCIFAANVIPSKNDAFKAVLARCDIYELSATNEEVLELMRCVSVNGFHGLTPDDCAMVIDFIAENSEDRQLSMRLLGPSLRKLQYARAEGSRLAAPHQEPVQTLGRKQQATKRLDTKSRDMKLLREALKRFPEDRQEPNGLFLPAIGKSRASFYRVLSRVKDE